MESRKRKSHLKRVLISVAVLLPLLPVLFVGVLILAQAELDLAPYRDTISRWASTILDHKVVIDGELRIALGMQPSLALSRLRVFEAEAEDDSAMLVKAEQLFARVNLGMLFGRRLQVIELKLAGGELNMRINPTDRSRPGMSDSDTDIEALLLDAALIPDQAHIEITDSRTRYEDPERGIHWLLELATAHMVLKDASTPLELAVTGVWNDLPLEVSANIRPSGDGTAAAGELVALTAQALDAEVKAEGVVTDFGLSTRHFELEVEARTGELSRWRKIFGDAVPAVQQASLHGHVSDGGEILQLANLAVRLERASVSGDLSLHHSGARPAIEGSLQVTDLDTRMWLRSDPAGKEVSVESQVSPLEQLARFPLPWLVDARVAITGRNITLLNGQRRSVAGNLSLDEHALRLEIEELDSGNTPLKALLHKDNSHGVPTYAMKLKDPDLDLAALVADSDLAGQVEGDIQVDVDLRSRGASADAIRAALEGHVRMLMGAGKANVQALDHLVGGLTAAVGQVIAEKSKLAVVNCAITDVKFATGVGGIELGLIDTEYSTVLVDGNFDLGKQTLDLMVTPRKKAFSLSVAPQVQITGSTSNPQYVIEKGSLFLSLGEFITNIAYPPTLLVGAFGEVATTNPCVEMLSGNGG
jgi:uncharacterized protein involved in outer membrane biogenesis